jgi:ATP-binding cassette subfamily F protein 3
MKSKKGKALQNRLSKIESQIKQLEKDIQHDDKMLASNYNKTLKMLLSLKHTIKEETELDKLLLDWEVVQEEIDKA